jgi:dTDP-4-dehydrorhamnose reductase
MRLLVTGAAGMLGQDVVAAALAAGHDVSALARRDLDITDADAVAAAVDAARPDAIVNCAAWTDVDGAEAAEDAATRVNGAGTGHVGAAAAAAGAHVVHVSTDYVFDGRATRPYVESDPTGPQSAYGRSKLAGERALDLDRAAVVRASWLFGPGGPNFVATMLRLARDRDEVTVVDDQVGFPTYTGHLAPALLRLAEARATGILHATGADPCSWHDFAVAIFARAGAACAVRRGRTADLGRPAPRPAYSVLGTERADAPLLEPWRDGLAAYLDEIKVTQT